MTDQRDNSLDPSPTDTLGISEHMAVVGSDGELVGKVDKLKGDTIILTKSDSTDGRHHSISRTMIDRVENGQVILSRTAEEAKEEAGDPDRDRSLAETDDQGEAGPHILDKSFSGTY